MVDKRHLRRKSAQKRSLLTKLPFVSATFPETPAQTTDLGQINSSKSITPAKTSTGSTAVSMEQIREEIQLKINPAMNNLKQEMKIEIEKITNENQVRYTEVLGVFVALLTFVSLNIQIFNQIDTLNYAVFIVLLIFLCLAWFIFLLDRILTKKSTDWKLISIITFIVIVLSIITLHPFFLRPIAPFQLKIDERIKQLESKVEQLEWKIEVISPGWWDGGK